MDRHNTESFINILISASFLLVSLTGCNLNGNHSDVSPEDSDGIPHYYSSVAVDLMETDKETSICNVIAYNGKYYAITHTMEYETFNTENHLICVDAKGNIESDIILNSNIKYYSHSDIINGKLNYVTFNDSLDIVDLDTGTVIDSIQYDTELYGVAGTDESYVVIASDHIYRYDLNSTLLSTVNDESWSFTDCYRPYFEADGVGYLISGSFSHKYYYKLDFENGTSTPIYDSRSDGKIPLSCSGQYIFDDTGEYLLDLNNTCKYPLAIWNEMDLQPAMQTWADPLYIGINDESFIQIYNYEGGMAQFIIYTYEPESDYNDRIILTVGGFGCKNDDNLKQAVYKYNTSQSDYRVIIDDYSESFSGYDDSEMLSYYAGLIKNFNEGNAPDVFYGNSFDYDYFASSGMTLNISEYMSPALSEKMDAITPNIRGLMYSDDGSCHRIFSSYQLEGYISYLSDDADLTITEAERFLASYDIKLSTNISATDFAMNAIMYSLPATGMYSTSELRSILEFAVEYGYEDYSYYINDGLSRTNTNEYLLTNYGIYSCSEVGDMYREYGDGFVWVGYPSLYSSEHVIVPFGEVALSASTDYPEACCDFMSFLLDDDVQDFNNLSCKIPVIDIIMRKMVYYSTDFESISDEDIAYRKYLSPYYEASPEAAEDFLGLISLADTVEFYDWGIRSIIIEELSTYYSQNKPIEDIADSIHSRIDLYLSES